MFVLFNIIILFVLGFVEGSLSKSYREVLGLIYQLAVLIPTIAVGICRMHDTDHKGWWLLFPHSQDVFSSATRSAVWHNPTAPIRNLRKYCRPKINVPFACTHNDNRASYKKKPCTAV